MITTGYRADIDGMRAIAVTLVTLFHLNIQSLAGGYIGVDIFFVISGFLISSIIWTKKSRGEFRLRDFYLGRIRRLLPPLYATVLVTFVAAGFILLPDDFARFSRSAIATLFSVSNILFYFEAGYWDTSSHLKPLLHTWSLGVEEQFYLIWPLFIIFCATTLRRVPFVLILLLVSGLSTWAMLWYSERDISGAFYLFPFRVFQFSLGALVAFAAQLAFIRAPLRVPLLSDLCAVTGLALIGFSTLTLGATTPFPGINALPPTLAAMLLLYAGSRPSGQGPLGRLLLTNPLSVFLGKISYAAYLVQWPIIVLYRYETGSSLSIVETSVLGTVILVAAILLHYGVERRFYNRAGEAAPGKPRQLNNGAFAFRMLLMSVVMTAVAAHAWFNSGWIWRMPQIVLTPEQIESGKQARFKFYSSACAIKNFEDTRHCARMDGSQTDVLVFGNSHEADGYNFILSGYGSSEQLQLIKFGEINKCGAMTKTERGWTAESEGCRHRLDTLFSERFLKNLDVVVFSFYLPYSITNASSVRILEDLRRKKPDLKIVIFGGYIGMKEECSYILNKSGKSATCRERSNVDYFEKDPSSRKMYPRLAALTDAYIDRVGLHCIGRRLETCETETPDGVPFLYDRHHASLEFATYGGKKYAAENPGFFQQLVRPRQAEESLGPD
ncbi:MAG: acyltransferase [Haliea sp.]|nr:acyltransferase [Haliea sp.]